MVKAVVLYRPPEDPDAFERYYADTHTALAQRIPGLQRFEAARGFATPDGGAVPYQRIAELTFEDVDALQGGTRTSCGPPCEAATLWPESSALSTVAIGVSVPDLATLSPAEHSRPRPHSTIAALSTRPGTRYSSSAGVWRRLGQTLARHGTRA